LTPRKPEVQNYVVTYAIEEVAQNAAARMMFGEAPFRGKLPVGIPGIFEIGAGYHKIRRKIYVSENGSRLDNFFYFYIACFLAENGGESSVQK
jgi:hypothetical protein